MVVIKNDKQDSKQKRLIQVNAYDQDYICLMGKNINPAKLQKRMRKKPRLFGTILMNLFIILIIVSVILVIIGF